MLIDTMRFYLTYSDLIVLPDLFKDKIHLTPTTLKRATEIGLQAYATNVGAVTRITRLRPNTISDLNVLSINC